MSPRAWMSALAFTLVFYAVVFAILIGLGVIRP